MSNYLRVLERLHRNRKGLNLMHKLSYGNEFDLCDNERASQTHFRMKDCAPGLVLKQRQKSTRKWPFT